MAANGRAIAGGVTVLVATAFVTIREFGSPQATLGSQIAGIALIVLLLAGAGLLARFIQNHGDEIGEAQFDTRNKDGRDG